MFLLKPLFSCKKIRLKMVYEKLAVLQTSPPLTKSNGFRNFSDKYSSASEETFENAVAALNSLQPNSAVIQESILRRNESEYRHISETQTYLRKIGINYNDLSDFPAIHVAGTKGKGSTCALTESILRSFGLRTGFFSSPHLVSVTERIRIDGDPISRENFTKYFWHVYNSLHRQRDHDNDMPQYFKFLTVLSFYVFKEEKVDVSIYEVGIGGQYDPTNVLPATKTVGITSLGLEHTQLLGDTLEEIAWQKAGIIKNNSNVFTVQQPDECLGVINDRTNENNATLHFVPRFVDYNWPRSVTLTIDHDVQRTNASLAIQLAYNFMATNRPRLPDSCSNQIDFLTEKTMSLHITDEIMNGLEKCIWPGRCQQLVHDGKMLYLDGAHTIESIQICIDWYERCVNKNTNPRCLIYNSTGDRDYEKMLALLNDRVRFDYVFFCPNVPSSKGFCKHNSNYVARNHEQSKRCHQFETAWINLNRRTSILSSSVVGGWDRSQNDLPLTVKTCDSVTDVFTEIDHIRKNKDIDVLVTGSLHLIGATLLAIEEFKETYVKNS